MMTKKITLLLAFLLICTFSYGRKYYYDGYYYYSEDNGLKKNYITLSFVNTAMEQEIMPDFKSNYGASVTIGRTFFVHKNPLFDFLSFGIDATWLDLTYTNYDVKHITYWATRNYQYHQGEISMQVGPSVTLNIVDKFNVQGYFRYAPSFSVLYSDDAMNPNPTSGNYATFFVGGGSVSYGAIGLGFEARFGDCKYKPLTSSDGSSDIDACRHYSGWKAYLMFRF